MQAQYIIPGDEIINPFLGVQFVVTERTWESTSQGTMFLLSGVQANGQPHKLSLFAHEVVEVVKRAGS